MISILTIKCVSCLPLFSLLFPNLTSSSNRQNSIWSFLTPYQTSSTSSTLPRSVIALSMTKRPDLARFIISLVPSLLDSKVDIQPHRALLAFWTAVTAEYIQTYDALGSDDGIVAFLLSELVKGVESSGSAGKDIIVSSTPPPFNKHLFR